MDQITGYVFRELSPDSWQTVKRSSDNSGKWSLSEEYVTVFTGNGHLHLSSFLSILWETEPRMTKDMRSFPCIQVTIFVVPFL